jgi:hypothetical protein
VGIHQLRYPSNPFSEKSSDIVMSYPENSGVVGADGGT